MHKENTEHRHTLFMRNFLCLSKSPYFSSPPPPQPSRKIIPYRTSRFELNMRTRQLLRFPKILSSFKLIAVTRHSFRVKPVFLQISQQPEKQDLKSKRAVIGTKRMTGNVWKKKKTSVFECLASIRADQKWIEKPKHSNVEARNGYVIKPSLSVPQTDAWPRSGYVRGKFKAFIAIIS